MTKILMGTMAFAGHVNPGLPIARKLVERGNQVWWYTGKKYQSKVEATGAKFVPMTAGHDYDDADLEAFIPKQKELTGLAKLKDAIKHVFADAMIGHVQDLVV